MHPILFTVGSVTIFSFGLFLALAILVGSLCFAILAKYSRLNLPGFFDNILFMIFVGVVGARIAYVITYPQYFRFPQGSWTNAFALWQGGLVFYGAIFGGLFAVWLILRSEKQYILKWLNILILGFLLAVALGQTGCQFGGCALGQTSSAKLAIDGRLPIALYEAIFSLLLFVFGLVMYLKKPLWRKDGKLFFVLSLVYLVGRVLCDYFREPLVMWRGLSASIIVDIVLIFAVTITMLIAARVKMFKKDAEVVY
ncbi:MAG: prolipoprotein diacylglyceryl transferase family protein [Patescibacteria group bacterium]|jgi:phosphatidylglycerol:prolipoprotein diacylglycerol transferase